MSNNFVTTRALSAVLDDDPIRLLDSEDLKAVVIVTFTVYIDSLLDLLGVTGERRRQQLEVPDIYVIYQHLHYRPEDNPRKIAHFRDKYAEEAAEHGIHLIRYPITWKNQINMHWKCIFFYHDNPARTYYVQLSQNIDKLFNPTRLFKGQNDSNRSPVVYAGVPNGLRQAIKVLATLKDRLIARSDELMDGLMDWLRKMHDKAGGGESGHDHLVAQYPQSDEPPGPNAPSLEGSASFDERATVGQTMVMKLRGLLQDYWDNRGLAYSKERQDDHVVSSMVMHFTFASVTNLSNVCKEVAQVLSVSGREAQKTELIFTYPEPSREERNAHESWIAKMARGHMMWFLLTSCNLTERSWGPAASNYEISVLSFSKDRISQSNILTYVNEFLSVPYEGIQRADLACRRKSIDIYHRAPDNTMLPTPTPGTEPPPLMTGCRWDVKEMLEQDSIGRFDYALQCLDGNLLPNLVGAGTLLMAEKLRKVPLLRWALYQYLLLDVPGDLLYDPLQKNFHVQRQHILKHVLSSINDNDPDNDEHDDHRWRFFPAREETLAALADILMRWSCSFALFNPSLASMKVEPSRQGFRCLDRFHHHNLSFFAPPPTWENTTSLQDSVTYLMQRTYSSRCVWWRCPLGHRFFWPVRRMMINLNPSCMVCEASDDIRILYDLLRARMEPSDPGQITDDKYYVHHLTVELPVVKFRPRMSKADPPKRGRGKSDADVGEQPVETGEEITDNADEAMEVDAQESAEPDPAERLPVEMRYDVFFAYGRKKRTQDGGWDWDPRHQHMCAVEYDDASHARGQNVVRISLNADASKNIVSSRLGIHLLRIVLLDDKWRTNAASKLNWILDTYLRKVTSSKVNLLRHGKTIDDVTTAMRERCEPLNATALDVKKFFNPRLGNDNPHSFTPGEKGEESQPISMMVTADSATLPAFALDKTMAKTIEEEMDAREQWLTRMVNLAQHTIFKSGGTYPWNKLMDEHTLQDNAYILATCLDALDEPFPNVENGSWKGHVIDYPHIPLHRHKKDKKLSNLCIIQDAPKPPPSASNEHEVTFRLTPLEPRAFRPRPIEEAKMNVKALCREIIYRSSIIARVVPLLTSVPLPEEDDEKYELCNDTTIDKKLPEGMRPLGKWDGGALTRQPPPNVHVIIDNAAVDDDVQAWIEDVQKELFEHGEDLARGADGNGEPIPVSRLGILWLKYGGVIFRTEGRKKKVACVVVGARLKKGKKRPEGKGAAQREVDKYTIEYREALSDDPQTWTIDQTITAEDFVPPQNEEYQRLVREEAGTLRLAYRQTIIHRTKTRETASDPQFTEDRGDARQGRNQDEDDDDDEPDYGLPDE